MIELGGWAPDTEVYIAAHAVVCGSGEEPMFAQGWLTTVTLYTWSEAWDAGTVTAAIDGENLVVTFETKYSWVLNDTHLYLDAIAPPTWPPPWADFPYKHEGLGGVTTDTYVIPLSSLGVECNDILYISAHAYMVNFDDFWTTRTRHCWAEENPDWPWLKYFTVTLPCEHVCETAWGDGPAFPGKNWAMFLTYEVQ